MSEMTNANMEPTTTPKKERPKKSVMREIMEWIITFAIAFGLAMLIRTFLFEPVRVDGESMLNTLHNNEYMIATKWDYLTGDPQRFHVVICKYPDRTQTFVKRIVGLPGETVELRSGELYINGEYVAQNFDHTPSRSNYGPFTVPEGKYFVMGDNRDHSNDSRNERRESGNGVGSGVGPLDRGMIRGHVQYVVFPFTQMRAIPDPE